MPSMNEDNAEEQTEGYNNGTCVQPVLRSVNSTHQVELEKDTSIRDLLLRKLGMALSDPLHCRLLSVYASINASSAKESMEHELASILLEVLDRAD